MIIRKIHPFTTYHFFQLSFYDIKIRSNNNNSLSPTYIVFIVRYDIIIMDH